jgi:hypothetical protein
MTITRDDPRFWDVRLLERRLRKGQISKKDYEKYLKSLPDAADKQAPIDLAAVDDEGIEDDFDDSESGSAGPNGVHSE